jgi:AcrR family transcriptional regulator
METLLVMRFAYRFTELISCGKPSCAQNATRRYRYSHDVKPASTPSRPDPAPPPRRRGRPRRAAARQAIVDATLQLLAERGFQAATMDAIADRAGVSKNTIYRRWTSKEELIADALSELTASAELSSDGEIHVLLLEHIRDVDGILDDPLVGRLLPGLLGELQRNPAFAEAYAEHVVRPRRQAIIELLERAIDAGELRAGARPDEIADLLIGPLLLRHLFAVGLPPRPARYAELLLETIWSGIAPPGERVGS